MNLQLRSNLTADGDGTQIAHDYRISTRLRKKAEIARQVISIGIGHHGVHGHVHAHAVRMGIGDRIGQLGLSEIVGALAHTEAFAREIHRVGPEMNRIFQLFSAARRSEQFHRAHGRFSPPLKDFCQFVACRFIVDARV